MDKNVKTLYTYLVRWNRTPQEVFMDWNRFKRAAHDNDVKIPKIYPDYVKWVIRYKVR